MDEEKPSEIRAALRFDLINSGEILAATLAIRIMISELAAKDREPHEAQKYVDEFKAKMERFVSAIEVNNDSTYAVVKQSMDNYIVRLFAGMQFEKENK